MKALFAMARELQPSVIFISQSEQEFSNTIGIGMTPLGGGGGVCDHECPDRPCVPPYFGGGSIHHWGKVPP